MRKLVSGRLDTIYNMKVGIVNSSVSFRDGLRVKNTDIINSSAKPP